MCWGADILLAQFGHIQLLLYVSDPCDVSAVVKINHMTITFESYDSHMTVT